MVTSGMPDPFGEFRKISDALKAFNTPLFDMQMSALRDAMKITPRTLQLIPKISTLPSVVPQLKAVNLHPAVAALPKVTFSTDVQTRLADLTAGLMPDLNARIWENFQLPNLVGLNVRWIEEQAAAVERLRAALEAMDDEDLPVLPEDSGGIGAAIGGLDWLLSLLRVPALSVEQKMALLGIILQVLMFLHTSISDAQMHEAEMREAKRQTGVLTQIADDISGLPDLEDQGEEMAELREELEDLRARLDDDPPGDPQPQPPRDEQRPPRTE